MSNYRIVLASGSPRRKELLSTLGLPFTISIPGIDETKAQDESPSHYVKRLSLEKAQFVFSKIRKKSSRWLIVIAADTTVVLNQNTILEKPRNKVESLKMIRSLSGRRHAVLTGTTVLASKSGRHSPLIRTRATETSVWMRKLSRKGAQFYCQTGEGLDKAGSYAAQGFGMSFVKKIEGSFTNVVGLPMAELVRDLRSLGVEVPFS